jgi:hypothetical protein
VRGLRCRRTRLRLKRAGGRLRGMPRKEIPACEKSFRRAHGSGSIQPVRSLCGMGGTTIRAGRMGQFGVEAQFDASHPWRIE